MKYYLLNSPKLAVSQDYVALSEEMRRRALTNFVKKNYGTHFVTEDMEKQHGSVVNIFVPENLMPVMEGSGQAAMSN